MERIRAATERVSVVSCRFCAGTLNDLLFGEGCCGILRKLVQINYVLAGFHRIVFGILVLKRWIYKNQDV